MVLFQKVSLQTKIIVLISALIFLIICILSISLAYIESKEIETEVGEKALQAATIFSHIPEVKAAFATDDPTAILQPIALSVQETVGAEFVVVGNKDSIRYAHPNEKNIGKRMVGGDNDPALLKGEYYISKAKGSLGQSLRGKAPIYDGDDIVGIVSVGFLLEDIQSIFWKKVFQMILISFVVLIIGVVGSILLARNIRKDTFGLEPYEIAALYVNRNAILSSIKEGVIAVNQEGTITIVNESAKEILELTDNVIDEPIENVIVGTKVYDVLETGKEYRDDSLFVSGKEIIVNRKAVLNNKQEVIGVVCSFRDKTDLDELLQTLEEVKRYSKGLRAQKHEYTNRLYAISGLLQLEKYDEAIELIQQVNANEAQLDQIFENQLQDPTINALLLAKISDAEEKKIALHIDEASALAKLPGHMSQLDMVTILGNLIDNAIDATVYAQQKVIHIFITDIGNDIVFEIADSGSGIDKQIGEDMFSLGYTTKESGGGYGLALVKHTIEQLDGTIEVTASDELGGALFSVFIPKEKQDRGVKK